jgi:hypothetical protein
VASIVAALKVPVNVGLAEKTNAPDPVSSVTAAASWAEVAVNVLLAKFIVLLVSVSVVALPTKVSVEVGSVNVPVLTIELITGVVNVGDVPKTNNPEPVSFVTAPASCAEVKDPSDVALPTDVTAPVKLALVVTFPAVNPAAVPVMFVPTRAE